MALLLVVEETVFTTKILVVSSKVHLFLLLTEAEENPWPTPQASWYIGNGRRNASSSLEFACKVGKCHTCGNCSTLSSQDDQTSKAYYI
jgi:hypothetical protein